MKNISLSKSRIIFALLTAAVMVCIFLFSCENAEESSDTSGFFVNIITNIFSKKFNGMSPDEQTAFLDNISHLVRKTAHFTIFAALGTFASLTAGRRRIISLRSLGVLGFCFLYACTDELHQYFVPQRACMFSDVLLDTCGGLAGILFSFVLLTIFKNKHKLKDSR
ncbi:MAG: VanZ family protein [Ruminococcus sp.]|nr:VanZ family protein [Ruminococcus sp.]